MYWILCDAWRLLSCRISFLVELPLGRVGRQIEKTISFEVFVDALGSFNAVANYYALA